MWLGMLHSLNWCCKMSLTQWWLEVFFNLWTDRPLVPQSPHVDPARYPSGAQKKSATGSWTINDPHCRVIETPFNFCLREKNYFFVLIKYLILASVDLLSKLHFQLAVYLSELLFNVILTIFYQLIDFHTHICERADIFERKERRKSDNPWPNWKFQRCVNRKKRFMRQENFCSNRWFVNQR